MSEDFVHLHVHTDYSLLDGAARIPQLVRRAAEVGMPALAITDHGNMFGAIEFYKAALDSGIKPIIGSEVYVCRDRREEKRQGISSYYHLVLLVEDYTGYKNLMKLSTIGYLDGFYYKPRIDRRDLAEHAHGLIALSGCLKGEIASIVAAGRLDTARKVVEQYKDIFGQDNFFIEVQDQGVEEQRGTFRQLVELGRELKVPVVATNDCHYVYREEAPAHDVLLCIQTNNYVHDENRMRFPTDEFYLKTGEEMAQRFSHCPEALTNTAEIAHRCNLNLDFQKVLLPRFKVPDSSSADEYLTRLCEEGLRKRFKRVTSEIRARLEHELSMIKDMGYSSYFLIVWDFIRYAREQGIPVGPGRGSAAGSLVSYILEITDLDPLKYGLLFERFLNPSRITMPDIDIDFCYERREEIIRYVTEKYGGVNNVSQIITFGTMAARAAIKDVGRALGMPYNRVDQIAKLVPYELNITLEKAREKEPALMRLIEQDDDVARLWTIARSLEGLTRHASTHAAGVVISDKPLTEYLPLYKSSAGDITTQCSMNCLEDIGLLKMDFLGLRTLTVIADAVEMISDNGGQDIDIRSLPLGDKKTFKLLNEGRTKGVFQLESSGMRDLAKKIGMETFDDIIALVALFRPGPMHMLDDYVRRKHGLTKVRYEHPKLKPILKETYGVMLYQEQVMRIARELGDFSLAEADTLRKAMGKKIPEEMDRNREAFIDGAGKNDIDPVVANKIFDKMAQFAGYGFVKSHSAAYALIAYQTAYLKANFPVEFMASLLSSEMGNSDKIVSYIDECRKMSIEVLPPDVNESFSKFTVVGGKVRFGLAAVKNVGKGAIKIILEDRDESRPFKSIFDFCSRVDMRVVNRRVLESLVMCGAFDSTGAKRSQLFQVLDRAIDLGLAEQRDREEGQASLFDLMPEEAGIGDYVLPDVSEWPEGKLLRLERETLGFYVTGHPLVAHAAAIERYANATSESLANFREGDEVTIGGIITDVRSRTTRKGEGMAFITLEDLGGFIEVIAFSPLYGKVLSHLVDDTAVMVRGKLDLKDAAAKVVADKILPISEIEGNLSGSVHVRLMTAGLDDSTLDMLGQVFTSHPGHYSVFLHCKTHDRGEAVIQAGSGFSVEPSEMMIEDVERLLGAGTIWYTQSEGLDG